MLDHIGQRLLDDAIKSQIRAHRQLGNGACDRELSGEAACAPSLDQRREPVDPESRHGPVLVALAQHAHDAAQFGHRGPAGRRHFAECRSRHNRVVANGDPGHPRLHHHDADAVGHDVVQLAGHAVAFLRGDRSQAQLLLVPQLLVGRRQALRQTALASHQDARRRGHHRDDKAMGQNVGDG